MINNCLRLSYFSKPGLLVLQLAQPVVYQVFLGYLGSTEEMEPRATKGLWEYPAKWDLKVPKGTRVPKASRVSRPLGKTGNNVRGRILTMGETMG